MDSKGVSGLMVAIFLTLISVGLAFGFLIFGRETQESFEEEVGGSVEGGIRELNAGIAVVDVDRNEVTLRNTGRNVLDASDVSFLVDGGRVETNTTAASVNPGETAIFTLKGFVPGVHTLRASGPSGTADEGTFALALPGTVALWDFEDADGFPDDSVGNNHGRLNGTTVLLLNMDEGSGAKAADATGYGHNGTLASAATWTAGIAGNGLNFDGSGNAYVSISDSPALRLGTQQTVSIWYKWNGAGGDWMRFIGKGDTTNRNYGLWMHPNGDLLFQVYGTPNSCNAGKIETLDTNWHHLAGTYDGATINLYLDGEFLDDQSCVTNPHTGNYPVTLAYANAGASPFHAAFNGALDEAAVYTRAMSADEIKELYDTKRVEFGEYVDGAVSTAVAFDGADDLVEVPDSSSLDIINTITIEGWFSLASGDPNTGHSLAEKWNVYGLRLTPTGANTLGYVRIGGVICEVYGSAIGGGWHHAAFTYDGASAKFYTDGTLTNTQGCSGSIDASGNQLWMGRNEGGGRFNGTIDYVALYNRALSPVEIAEIYEAATS